MGTPTVRLACEDILGVNESYAHQWINRKDHFRLLERMNLAVPVARTLHGLEFSGTEHWRFDGAS